MSDDESNTSIDEGLSEKQLEALCAVQNGESFFLTGGAGTGKSETIKRIVQWLNSKQKRFLLCATTGIAAVNIGGRTLHTSLRLPIDSIQNEPDVFQNQVMENLHLATVKAGHKRGAPKTKVSKQSQNFLKQLRSIEYIIVDEVSMMSCANLEQMNLLFQAVRNSSQPMGQVRCVLVGDFFQLPPVMKTTTKFLFESPVFWKCIQKIIRLDVCFRQQDLSFVELLNRCRIGKLNAEDIAQLQGRLHQDIKKLGIEPTVLQSRNFDVDRVNQEKLSIILRKYAKRIFSKKSFVLWKQKKLFVPPPVVDRCEQDLEKQEKDLKIDPSLVVCEEAQVMLTYNLDVDRGLCNGARGVIVGFKVSEHVDDDSIFKQQNLEDPQCYPNESLPIVRFQNGVQILVPQVRFTRDQHLEDNDVNVPRLCVWQVPLKLAWATTVHKSQGLTLDCVTFQMDRSVFETGQAQVALSRVKTLEGLSLTSFDSSVIVANEKVVFFDQHSQDFLKDMYEK